ncbi:MAG: nitroreductase family protein [Xanthobacteraceae bacterium]
MPDNDAKALEDALAERFGERLAVDSGLPGLDELARIAGHRTHRRYSAGPVAPELVRLLCACALSAPSKSDLQQSDIIVVEDKALVKEIAGKNADMPWIEAAPVFLVFVGNGRRLPFMSALRGKPFPNDHLDLFFNAVSDASIVLATFIRAAEAVGLGCCPISAIRDHASMVSDLLKLPPRTFPVAGMCVGWPAQEGHLSPRLGLDATLHRDRHDERDLATSIDAYDRRRNQNRPPWKQRNTERFGEAPFYGWSEDKARQYAEPLRAHFGAFMRKKGFNLD